MENFSPASERNPLEMKETRLGFSARPNRLQNPQKVHVPVIENYEISARAEKGT